MVELGISTFGETTALERTGKAYSHAERIRQLLAEIELADKVGLDVYGIGEHHRADFAVSAPEIVLAAGAVNTKKIRLTSAVSILSSMDPIRLFQQYATIDALSNGRAEIMAGRGSFTESFPLFGYDLKDYEALFDEKLDLLQLVNEKTKLDWKGRLTQTISGKEVYPRPVQDKLPLWIATGGHGRGKEIKDPCTTCRGTGHEKQAHSVHVKIPAGVETGQQIRLAGQGEAGFNGGPYGDLYVVVSVEASDKFEREGTTIFYNLNLNFVQAALGDTVDIPTVHGDVELVIPEGTQTGKRFRLRGKGAPSLRGGALGDQYVTVNVVTPTGLNDRQKAALKEFAAAGDLKVNPKKKGFFDHIKDAFEGE